MLLAWNVVRGRAMFRHCRRLKFKLVAVLTLMCLGAVLLFLKQLSTNDSNRSYGAKLTTVQNTNVAANVLSSSTIHPRSTVATSTKHNTTTKKPVPDMVNDYYPFVDFSIVFPAISPNLREPQDLFLVVLVNSAAAKHSDQRDTIRETWASRETCEHRGATKDTKLGKFMKWLLVFVVGKSSTAQENEQNIEEAKKHNDMLIGNINDNYLNNVVKLYMGMLWASTLAPKYILKTDDDVYVRIPEVIRYLVGQNLPKHLYAGQAYGRIAVSRNHAGKWAISKKYYPEKYWPNFVGGGLILMSMDLVSSVFNFLKERKPFHTDDAYIGLAMQELKVKVVNLPFFCITRHMPALLRGYNDCKVLSLAGFAHNIDSKTSRNLHRRVEALCTKNFNKSSCQRHR